MTAEDDDRRRKLAVIATALGEEVAALRQAEKEQAEAFAALKKEVANKNYRTTIKIRWMIMLVIMDLVLSGAMLVGYLKIKDVVDDQAVIRSQVFCPLYSIFVRSYNPNSLAAKAQGIDEYNRTFDEIKHQNAALRCK